MTDRPAKTAKSQRTKAAILKAAQQLVVAMDRAQIVRLLGPTMQRYVVGKL